MKGKVLSVGPEFFEPLPEEELKALGRRMKALLDTHAFLWWLDGDPSLSRKRIRRHREAIREPCLVSAASAWEIATKHRLGKLPRAADVAG